jgi:hypothetical protein
MGRVAQTPLAAVGLLTPAPRSAATTAHRHYPCVAARHVIGRLLVRQLVRPEIMEVIVQRS